MSLIGRAVRSGRRTGTHAMLLAASLLAGACGEASAPAPDTLALRLDLRSLGGGAALGNAASVLARITLSIGLPNQDGSLLTRDFTVSPTDSMVETTVDLSPGPYSFVVNAYSNNNTPIYFLSTVAFLGDGRDVQLIPQATDAVLVVGPADAGLGDNLIIRNVGNRGLLWIADCVSAQSATCDGTFFADPVRGTLAPGASETMRVCAFGSANVFTIGFASAVGTVTVRKAARVAPPGTNLPIC